MKKTTSIGDTLANTKSFPFWFSKTLKADSEDVSCSVNAGCLWRRSHSARKRRNPLSARLPGVFLKCSSAQAPILNTADLHRAFDAGAKFAVAPGFNPTVVGEAMKHGYAFAPGICTPSEIEQAYELGCRFFKFFPAEAAGGVKMLKSIAAPYKHLGIKFMPTGGVTIDNAADWLAVPEVSAAVAHG